MFELSEIRYKNILNIKHLAIPDKQCTALVGKSGSGKTTLLRMLNRLTSPDEGNIIWNGQDITTWDPVHLRRKIVMLPQKPIMWEGSIADNLNLGRVFSEQSPLPEADLATLLQNVHLEKTLNEIASRLSGGEQQRVALARVLAMDAEVLLLDEPSSALDRGTEREVLQEVIDHAKKRATTIIMVTHAQDIAEAMSDTLVTIDSGRLISVEERQPQ